MAELGVAPETLVLELEQCGILGSVLEIIPLTAEDGLAIAELRPLTRVLGLSLGDRACLALGRRLGAKVFTADRVWQEVAGIDVQLIR